jgi:hypothetical protein
MTTTTRERTPLDKRNEMNSALDKRNEMNSALDKRNETEALPQMKKCIIFLCYKYNTLYIELNIVWIH